MQAVMLAAGKGTRTYPFTLEKPKHLLKVANRTIIEHNLEQLKGLADEILIVVGKEKFTEKLLGNNYKGIRIRYLIQEKPEGNGQALMIAERFIKDRFIAMVADDLYSGSDIKKCLKHRYCVLVKEVDDLSRFGEVSHKGSLVTGFMEKPGRKKGLANTGLQVYDRKIFSHRLMKSKRGEFEIVDYITYLIEKGEKVHYEKIADYWFPITYPWSLLEANEFLLSKIKKAVGGEVEKYAVLKGPVVVGKGTIIKSGSYIEGPVIIGENCSIGPNCYIRAHSSIGNSCKIGNAVEVKNTIVGDRTSIGHLSYAGDSVIGDDVNFGAGTIIANLRHDGENISSPVKGEMTNTGRKKFGAVIGDGAKLGIKTIIYPGRKIWPEKTTLPGEIVKRDVQ